MSKKQGKGKKVKIQRVRLRGEASEEAALRIEELARGLRSGSIRLADGDVAIEAPAGSELSWVIEARSGRRRSRIEIEIRWRAPEASESADEDDDDEEEEDEGDGVAVVASDGAAPAAETPEAEAPGPQQELENPSW